MNKRRMARSLDKLAKTKKSEMRRLIKREREDPGSTRLSSETLATEISEMRDELVVTMGNVTQIKQLTTLTLKRMHVAGLKEAVKPLEEVMTEIKAFLDNKEFEGMDEFDILTKLTDYNDSLVESCNDVHKVLREGGLVNG